MLGMVALITTICLFQIDCHQDGIVNTTQLLPIGDKVNVENLVTPNEYFLIESTGIAVLELNVFQDESLSHPTVHAQLYSNDTDAPSYTHLSVLSTTANLTVALESPKQTNKNFQVKMQVNVTLPLIELNQFSVLGHGDIIALHWFPSTIHNLFAIQNAVGATIIDEIQVKYLNLTSQVGMVRVGKATVLDSAELHSKVGAVHANLVQFKDLSVSSATGSISLSLQPTQDANMRLSSEVGSVHATVSQFSGSYLVQSGFGSCSVNRPQTISRDAFGCKRQGKIGSLNGYFESSTRIGSNKIEFL